MSRAELLALASETLWFAPVWLAYRILWLVALTGNRDAEDVYIAMWAAGLDLPPIARLVARAQLITETRALAERMHDD